MKTKFMALFTALLLIFLFSQKSDAQTITVLNQISCTGSSDGELMVNPEGIPPYDYIWSTSDTTAVINNLSAGIYSVTVTDDTMGVVIYSDTLTDPAPVTDSVTSQVNVSCFGNSDGTVSVIGSGVAPISYLWSNSEITPSINNLSAGDYTVTVTDKNGCFIIDTVSITQPGLLYDSVVSITPSDCDGHNNGAVDIVVIGGTGPFSFFWREISTDSVYFSQNVSGIRGGNYELTLTDINECKFIDTVFVPNTFTVPTNITPTLYVCNGLAGNVSINSPLADSAYYFTYSWSSTYNTGSFVTGDTLPTWTTSTSFIAGTYMITATDNQTGCAAYYAGIINQSATPLVVNHTEQNNLCFEDNAGIINLYVTGGDPKPNYDVVWSGPNSFTSIAFSLFGLEVGVYSYIVTDDSVCSIDGTIQIGPTLPLQGSVTSTNISCNGINTGSAEASYSGGTGYRNYLWNTGATTPVISGLTAGNYSVTVTDSVGCTKTADVTITQPNPINIILNSMNDVSCNGYSDGNIYLTTFGGTGNLNYFWSHDSIASYTTEDLTNVTAGNWEIVVTDANGCSVDTTVTINQPPATSFEDSVRYISCNNGNDGFWEIIITTGIFSPYVAIFSTGDTISSDTAALAISGISAGNYSAIVYANNGCSWSFVQTFDQPLPMTVGLSNITDVVCKDQSTGSILLDNVHGGTEPYTYLWSNSMTTNPITGISAGTYTVIISDLFNCTIEETYKVSEPYNAMKFFPTITTTSCQQAEDGQIVLEEWDIYDSPYVNWFLLYDLTGTLIDSVNTGEVISNLEPGTYVGTVINNAGCFVSDSMMVVEKGEPDCVIIPNLITPNGDGYNDVFRVENGCHYDNFHVELFTDQNEYVFESDDCAFTWDPIQQRNAASNTVYFYYLTVNENEKTYVFKGSLNINY